jgi:hypothetical protein
LSDDVGGGGGENYRRERRAARDEPDDRAARDQQGRRDYSDSGALRRTGYDATTAHWALPMHDAAASAAAPRSADTTVASPMAINSPGTR